MEDVEGRGVNDTRSRRPRARRRSRCAAPSAFTRSKMPGSANHCSNRPMQLKTPSAPSAARRRESGSVTSPPASSTPAGSSSRALATFRTSATTSSPRSDQPAGDRVAHLAGRSGDQEPHRPSPSASRLTGAPAYPVHTLDRMARFRDPPDPLFVRLNASIGFDRRLAPYDIEQSRAHARALHAGGVLDDDELAADRGGPERRRGRGRGRLVSGRGRRGGHPHGDRAPPER